MAHLEGIPVEHLRVSNGALPGAPLILTSEVTRAFARLDSCLLLIFYILFVFRSTDFGIEKYCMLLVFWNGMWKKHFESW